MPAVRKGKGKARAPEPPKTEAVVPFGKQLAHTDKAVRDQAVRNLVAFLSRGGDPEDEDVEMESSGYTRLSEKEMAKLWKGLFYCFWMSDKPLVQQALASELADLLLRINPRVEDKSQHRAARLDAALAFLQGFWESLVREWNGIDRLRLDKYYMLIRRYVNATFRLMQREGWSAEAVDGVNAILGAEHGPMSWQDKSVPMSLATHLADVYLEELDKVLAASSSDARVPLIDVLAPHIRLVARTPNATVHKRVVEIVFVPLLGALQPEDERPPKAPELDHIAEQSRVGDKDVDAATLRRAVLRALFTEAAQETSVESNRRRIYQLVREEDDDEDDE